MPPTPTLAERLAKIAPLLTGSGSGRSLVSEDDVAWMHRILTRLDDEKVIEAAAQEYDNCVLKPGDEVEEYRMRAALSAALTAAMQMEE